MIKIGDKFNKWTIIDIYGQGGKVLCRCNCGREKIKQTTHIVRRISKQCRSCSNEDRKTHGLYRHPIYSVWDNMKARCNNPNNGGYSLYGGRGISVCDRWNDFKNFYDDMIKGYKKGLQLDRKNTDGNYEPSNCRWVTRSQNNMNTRSRENSSSKYKGVCWAKSKSKWNSAIFTNGKRKHLGYFDDEIEAAKTYNKAARKLFGEYAHLNNIKET